MALQAKTEWEFGEKGWWDPGLLRAVETRRERHGESYRYLADGRVR